MTTRSKVAQPISVRPDEGLLGSFEGLGTHTPRDQHRGPQSSDRGTLEQRLRVDGAECWHHTT